jgi:small conductance mechanosensitive channel
MKVDLSGAIRALTITLLLVGSGPFAAAQDAEEAKDKTAALTDEAAALVAELEENKELFTALRREAEGLEGEERLVAEREADGLEFDALEILHALADNVLEQERRGLDASSFRDPLVTVMQAVPATMQRMIDETANRIGKLRTARDESETAKAPEFEEQIAEKTSYIDTLISAMLSHAEKMEALGLDASEVRGFLAENLTKRARRLSERLALVRDRLAKLEGRLADTPDDADLRLKVDAATTRMEGIIANMTTTIEVMAELDLETTDYQRQLIQVTGDLSTDILDSKVALSLFSQWVENARNWIAENGARVIFNIVLVIAILFAFRVLANIARRLIARSLASSRVKISALLENMIKGMVSKVIMLFGVLVALSQLGVSLGPLLAGLGVAGFIVGFAMQDSLSNFASGMMILFYRPFDVGDLVEAGTVFGRVDKMTLVSTTFLTLDHQTLVVPNTKIWGDVIKNVTAQDVRRVDMIFGIGYGDDIPHAERVLASILKDHPKVLDDPEFQVKLHTLGESSVDFVVRPWVKTDDYWDVYWDVTREVKMRFDKEGIGIPFPQRDVHVYEAKTATA